MSNENVFHGYTSTPTPPDAKDRARDQTKRYSPLSRFQLTQSYEEHSEKIKGFNNHFHSTTDAKVSFTDWITPFTEH